MLIKEQLANLCCPLVGSLFLELPTTGIVRYTLYVVDALDIPSVVAAELRVGNPARAKWKTIGIPPRRYHGNVLCKASKLRSYVFTLKYKFLEHSSRKNDTASKH